MKHPLLTPEAYTHAHTKLACWFQVNAQHAAPDDADPEQVAASDAAVAEAEEMMYRSVGLEGNDDARLGKLIRFVYGESEPSHGVAVGVLIGLLLAEGEGWEPTGTSP
jgi:hypothetical protein